jgi:hypothetical protein
VECVEIRKPDHQDATNGQSSFEGALDAAGRPSMKLSNPDSAGPTATLEVVATGTHVKVHSPGWWHEPSILEQCRWGRRLLIDTNGVRRIAMIVAAEGTAKIDRCEPDGKPLN